MKYLKRDYKAILKKYPQLAGMIADRFVYNHAAKKIMPSKGTLLLIPVLILVFASCSDHKTVKKFRIGFSQCQYDLWRKTMQDEMKRELSFHDNIDFLYRDAEGSSQKQVQQIDELVKEGIDLLIISPNEVQPLTPAVEKVYESGIPVVLIDRRINSEKFTAFIGASNFEVGQNAGRYAVSLLKGEGTVIEIMGLSDASPFIDRHRGFMDIISQNKG
ncbi:MAG TPA: substrate-binding domain-containing protein, partial [Ignavibacteriaceae bacterium]